MSTTSAEQYAHEVSESLIRQMHRSGWRQVSGMPAPIDAARMILESSSAPADNRLADRIGAVWSGTRTRQALGLRTRQALSSRRANGTVLGVTATDGQVFYPLFQFRRRGGTVEVHPNLIPALKTLKDVDSWTVAAMLRSSDPDLGMSAAEWASSGRDQARLSQWAQTVKRELPAR